MAAINERILLANKIIFDYFVNIFIMERTMTLHVKDLSIINMITN